MARTRPTENGVVHYRPPRRTRQRPAAKMQPPLTPMIDVTFQLLLFFLLTCQFRQAEGPIPGTLPPQEIGTRTPQDVVPLKEILIELDPVAELGKVVYRVGDKRLIEPEALYRHLKALQVRYGDATQTPVMIKPRHHVPWRFVAEAWNQAVRAKFGRIGFDL
jgi:biopolymer transport protein ExbD